MTEPGFQIRSVQTTIHGRFLAIPPETTEPAPLLVGFHGYAEDAAIQLERLRAIPDTETWLKVSIQGLHRFYQRRSNQIVASWMTSQDRDLAIADNIAYVNNCIAAVIAEWPTRPLIAFAGFSQGAAMAFRAGVSTKHGSASVIAVGGDIPPELTAAELKLLSGVLIARGASDPLYTPDQFARDKSRLDSASELHFKGGHEWSGAVCAAASDFLRQRLTETS